jgi:hypothetical protein
MVLTASMNRRKAIGVYVSLLVSVLSLQSGNYNGVMFDDGHFD